MKTHELIRMIREPLVLMNRKGIDAAYVQHLDMFGEYMVLRSEGFKKNYIIAHLCEKYAIGRTKLLKIIGLLECEL